MAVTNGNAATDDVKVKNMNEMASGGSLPLLFNDHKVIMPLAKFSFMAI